VFIRQKCVEANPEITKRHERFVFTDSFLQNKRRGRLQSAGGVLLSRRGPLAYVLKDASKSLRWYNGNDVRNVGIPIRLADIINTLDEAVHKRERALVMQICEAWDMTHDDLTQQSEQTVDFLYGLFDSL
jgi:hypothetical protein